MKKQTVSNNFSDDKVITSYDETKVWIMDDGEKIILYKKSSEAELNTNLFLNNVLKGKIIVVEGEKFKINVPTVYEYDNGILQMEYCNGENLEFILRNKSTYEVGSKILNALLMFMIDNNLQWIDFAPRNVLINGNQIYIVDFEKGISNSDILSYLRNHTYEEYGSFLFLKDRMYLPDQVFDIKKETFGGYFIKDIRPKRIKAVADLLGYKDYLTMYEYLQIIKTFIIAEIPYDDKEKFIFPRVSLEQILKDKETNPQAFYNYGKEVIRINDRYGNSFVRERK